MEHSGRASFARRPRHTDPEASSSEGASRERFFSYSNCRND